MILKFSLLIALLMLLDSILAVQMIIDCIGLQNMQNNLSGNYALTNDIDCSATGSWNAGAGFMPIGNSSVPFTGTIDGRNHTIYNLTISPLDRDYVGLFGYVSGANATIMQIGLKGGMIQSRSSGSEFCCVGGLVGYNTGTINQSYVMTSVLGGYYGVGVLVGDNYGIVTHCYATGNASSSGWEIGGLVGANGGTISNSYATGDVSGSRYVGGLVGENDGIILNSYATGSVSGLSSSYYCGGLAGYNADTISNSYATSSISGTNDVGGLVGYNIATISNSYAIGTVIGSSNAGGLIGSGSGGAYSSYWDIQASGQTASIGGMGRNTLALYHNTTYLGWDFNCVWSIAEGNDTPQLTQNNCPSSLFMQAQISNCDELQQAAFLYAANISLTQDIDCSESMLWDNGAGFYPGKLTIGSFDGSGHTIVNLFINRTSINRIGLWGETSNGVQISNVILEQSVISGNTYVGSLVGYNQGAITQSFATSSVSGITYVGELVGYNGGTITQSSAADSVSGSSNYVGGLVGYNAGTITQSSATSSVSGLAYVGGLVGDNAGTITQSFAMGNVTGSSNSTGNYIGGLVGTGGTLIQCYAMGSVSGVTYVGGLAGSGGTISQCYATGSVSGVTNVGGLIGSGGSVTQCYATGSVSGITNVGGLLGKSAVITQCYATGSVSGVTNVGGLVGSSGGSTTDSYWDIQTSTQTFSDGGIGLLTQTMQQPTSFVGWDFATAWVINPDQTYPLLQVFVASPILFNPLNNITHDIGLLLMFTISSNTFVDPNGLALTYNVELAGGNPLPTWLLFKPATLTFIGTPLSGAQGTLLIEISVYNLPTQLITDSFQLTIPNRPPVINVPFTQQYAFNGQLFQFIVPTATFFDPDADYLQLSASTQTTSLPTWLSFIAVLGTFSGVSTSRGNQWINVTANDGFGGQVSALLQIITPNTAPRTTTTFPNQVLIIGQPFSFTVPANIFFDLDGDPLTYAATLLGGGQLLPWLNFNAQALMFQGTPISVGFLEISVIASDPYNATALLNFGVSVLDISDNSQPLLAIQMPDQIATVDQPFTLQLPTNMFIEPSGKALVYSAMLEGGAPLPSWLNFSSTLLVFSGVSPTAGILQITVQAKNSGGGFTLDTFTLTIMSNQNLPPLLQNPISNQVVSVGENYQFIIPSNTFIDVNSAPLTYMATRSGNSPLPGWLHFNPNMRTFTGTPSDTDTNLYAPRITMIEVHANNSIGTAITTFQLSVTGKSQGEIIINALITLVSVASTAFAIYRNRSLLWNIFLKKKYEKESKQTSLNEAFTYQFTVPSKQIMRVKIFNKVSAKATHKKFSKCFTWCRFNDYRELPDENDLPDGLYFSRDTMTLSGTVKDPADLYICALGYDGRYLEAFKLRCGPLKNEDAELQQM